MPRLPRLRPQKHACDSPHVVILGAGASRAACPSGDANGLSLPVMADLVEVTGIKDLLRSSGVDYRRGQNFEEIYERLNKDSSSAATATAIEERIRMYFASVMIPPDATLYDKLLLSLRPKDLIASFNWDPLLAQAFKRNRFLKED